VVYKNGEDSIQVPQESHPLSVWTPKRH